MKNTLRVLGFGLLTLGVVQGAVAQTTTREVTLTGSELSVVALDSLGNEIKGNLGSATYSIDPQGRWPGMYQTNKDKLKIEAEKACKAQAAANESCKLKSHNFNPNSYTIACYGKNKNVAPCQITTKADIICTCEKTTPGNNPPQKTIFDPITLEEFLIPLAE
jgi:hypothetical protein